MQIDFHHSVTYALSRLAGFPHSDARTIAYAAQYVDDAKNQGVIRFKDGHHFDHIASAHTVVPSSVKEVGEFQENLNNTLNTEAWVPFHFLPGNLGKPVGEGLESEMVRRMACTTDSPVAMKMWQACHANRFKPNGLHRLGITIHVYADTWAHREFVGLDHAFNRVRGLIHDEDGLHVVGEDILSRLAGAFPIGHGMVLTLPDQPSITWGYFDRDGNPIRRNNTEMFLEASERIFANLHFYHGDGWSEGIAANDKEILQNAFTKFNSEDEEARHEDWLMLLGQPRFSFGALSRQELAELQYRAKGHGSWKHHALNTTAEEDDPSELFNWTPEFEDSDWKRFHESLIDHRAEVLDRILPEFQLDPSKC
jgi:hypothetical protein